STPPPLHPSPTRRSSDLPGHYVDTADPWDGTGRVGIAGHRTTYLHPFFNLDQVQPGDTIQLLTGFGTYTYAVTRNFVLPEATARSEEHTSELQSPDHLVC